MVDALRQAGELITPSGCVIDLHPTAAPALVLVNDRVVGEVDTGNAKTRHRDATNAVATVIERGWFTLDGTAEFEFSTYADSVDELQEHILEDWQEGRIPDETMARARAVLAEACTARPRVRERVVINRLRPLRM